MASRGGSWVVAQFALIFLVFLAFFVPLDWPEGLTTPLAAAGVVLGVVGAAIVAWAARTMGRALTPFPEPARHARLIDGGPFRVVRHPIYSGGLAFLVGWALFAGPVALALTCVLAQLWVGKLRVEERRLHDRFPEYEAYVARVRYRLFPGIF